VKKVKTALLGTISLLMILTLASCGKKEIHQGGEGTNFPYTWQDAGSGKVVIKLDGSYGDSDYTWVYELEGDETIGISQSGIE